MLRILPRIVPANWTDDAQRARWPDVPLTVLMLALPLIGLIAIYSASIAVSYAETGDPHYYFRRQLLFLIVGLAAAFTMMRIDYHWFRPNTVPRHQPYLLALGSYSSDTIVDGSDRHWVRSARFCTLDTMGIGEPATQ